MRLANASSAHQLNDNVAGANLPQDLLWTIFKMNTDIFQDKLSLRRLRIASQVCRAWRNIIMDSPSLWSQVLDLNQLLDEKEDDEDEDVSDYSEEDSEASGSETGDTSEEDADDDFEGVVDEDLNSEDSEPEDADSDSDDDWEDMDGSPANSQLPDSPSQYSPGDEHYLDDRPWLKEIIKRSQKSPLFIKGIQICRPENVLLILRLLDKEWSRMGRIYLFLGSRHINTKTWKVLHRPAPVLESFQFYLAGLTQQLSDAKLLFNNEAPALTHFAPFDTRFDPISASWIPNIRSMTLTRSMTVTAVLDMLQRMPELRSLEMEDLTGYGARTPDDSSTPIGLPNLKLLVFQISRLQFSSYLLGRLNLPSSCSLDMKTSIRRAEAHGSRTGALLRPFSMHAKKFFGIYRPTKVSLTMPEESQDYVFKTTSPDGSAKFEFSCLIEDADEDDDQVYSPLLGALARAFSFPELSSATELETYLMPPAPADLLLTFLPLMPDIDTLDINERLLLHLFQRKMRRPIKLSTTNENSQQSERSTTPINEALLPDIFPRMTTLRSGVFDNSFADSSQTFYHLLLSLRAAGRPIKLLDVTQCSLMFSPNLRLLEEGLPELKLRWKRPGSRDETDIEEYVCGSGHPETIPFVGGSFMSPLADIFEYNLSRMSDDI